MPTPSEMNLNPLRRRSRLGVLAALSLTMAACGSTVDITTATNESTTPSVPIVENSIPGVSIAHGEKDGPQYGDSLDEFLAATEAAMPASSEPTAGFTEIEWASLIPPGSSGAEISARFDERIREVEPGSPEADAIFAELQDEYASQPVNPEVAGQKVQLAGFVAPLTFDGELITEFLLVPYFGACIHVPPPPPNQTVMVTLAKGQGLTIDESWGAVWVTGTLSIDAAETELAPAGYTITGGDTGVHNLY